jgi:hypothetical protein
VKEVDVLVVKVKDSEGADPEIDTATYDDNVAELS